MQYPTSRLNRTPCHMFKPTWFVSLWQHPANAKQYIHYLLVHVSLYMYVLGPGKHFCYDVGQISILWVTVTAFTCSFKYRLSIAQYTRRGNPILNYLGTNINSVHPFRTTRSIWSGMDPLRIHPWQVSMWNVPATVSGEHLKNYNKKGNESAKFPPTISAFFLSMA